MQTNKIDSYIGFAVKSRKVIFGLEMLLRARKPPFVVLYDESLGANSLKNMMFYCDTNNVVMLKISANHLNELLQRQNIKILSIVDESLSKAIIENSSHEQMTE
ncbi:MAG: hypothetical protein RR348_03395 [Clostridia bacterium]